MRAKSWEGVEEVTYEEQSNEYRTPSTKRQWNLFYSKVIARSVNTFIPLGDETINSSLIERGRPLMDPQSHPLGITDVHEYLFFRSPKCGSHKEKYLGCTENVEVFSSQISEAYTSLYCQYEDGSYHAKG